MPKLKINTGTDIQAPGVSLAQVSVAPSPIEAFTKEISPAVVNMAKRSAANKRREQVLTSSQAVMQEMNEVIDGVIGEIGADFNPTQAQDHVYSTMNDLMIKHNVPLESMGALSSQLDRRIKNMGKEHWFVNEGIQYVMEGATGEVRVIKGPGVDTGEELFIKAKSALSPAGQLWFDKFVQEKGEQAGEDFLIRFGKMEIDSEFTSANQKVLTHQMTELNLQEKYKDLQVKRDKPVIFESISKEIISPLSDAYLGAIEAGGDPELTYQSFRQEFMNKVEQRVEDLRTLGMTPTEVMREYEPLLEAKKEFFLSRSGQQRNKVELERINLKVAIEDAIINNRRSPEDRALLKDAPALQKLTMTMMILNKLPTPPTVVRLMSYDEKLTRAITINQELSPLYTKQVDNWIGSKDPADYKQAISYVMSQMNAVSFGTGKVSMTSDDLLESVLKLKASPLWADFVEGAPKAAEAIESGVERINKVTSE